MRLPTSHGYAEAACCLGHVCQTCPERTPRAYPGAYLGNSSAAPADTSHRDTCSPGKRDVELSDAGHRRYRPALAAQTGCGRCAGFGSEPLGCNHGTSASGASTASTGSVPTATIPEIAPSGGPTPAELQGSWELVSKSGKTFKNRFELVIPARHYGFPIGLVRGEIVAQGNEVDLYNEDLCGLAFPKGVGRYRWTLAGEMLHLDLIGKDPCACAGVLNDATYRRERLTKRHLCSRQRPPLRAQV
jgi:hypothetical protein